MLALRFRYTTACGDAEIRSCDELTVMRRMMMMMEQGAAAHLVFLFELFCGTKVQQAHVDQLLEVLVESKDVPPEGRSRTASRLEPPAAKTETGLGGGEGGSPPVQQLPPHARGQRSDQEVLLDGVVDVFLQIIHLHSRVLTQRRRFMKAPDLHGTKHLLT